MSTFAISRIDLDDQGHVIAVQWGRIDTARNTWATSEVRSPVSEVINAIDAGNPVFALFRTPRGHVPGRQFRIVPLGRKGREGIALDGPARGKRELRHMDRLPD